MPFSERGKERAMKLFMASTTERFALLYRLGVSERLIFRLDLEGKPSTAVSTLEKGLDSFETGLTAQIEEQVMTTPLPQGIPEN